MQPITELSRGVCQQLTGIFTDIDDTITLDGRLHSNAYTALENLHASGLAVVPVTGRPAGWCDLIARWWPVAGVIGENGAFYFRYDHCTKQMHRHYVDDDGTRQDQQGRLLELAEQVIAKIPGAAIAADQNYRACDLAIDIAEDVPPLAREQIMQIEKLLTDAGVTVKLSSIHVNAYFGNHDKLSMTKQYAQSCLGIELATHKKNFIFIGDSPNDAPMFAFFPQSVGVANVADFAKQLAPPPTYVTRQRGGDGLVELAKLVLAART